MTTNDSLFVRVLAQIEREPQRWNQRSWRCETGMCFAGWTTELSGLRWTEASTYRAPSTGRRSCRVCNAIKAARLRARRRQECA